jgi:DNA-binding CsgD family transcriptional regulator
MHEQLVDLMEEVIGTTDLGEFRAGLLRGVRRAVPSDWASLNDLGPGPGDVAVVLIPEPPPDLFEIFVRLRDQNPIVAYIERTRDGRATRFSDVATPEELHGLELYQRVYAPMGVHHQIAFTLPSAPDRIIGVALSRADPDYTDAERDLLNRARPLLIQAFRAAVEHDELRRTLERRTAAVDLTAPLRAAGLTLREAQAVAQIARGRSNRDAAAALGITPRTVAKHLERAFAKLGVTSRSEAAQAAWDLRG